MSNFLDEALVMFKSGRGGNGAVAFHTEKHVPRGGPNGADAGRGGDIILVADRHKRTLYDFKLLNHYEAPNGSDAHGNKRGKDAKDITLRVPVGTVVWDVDLDEMIVDMNVDGMQFVLCKGGKGGLGNVHFTTSVRQAPRFAQKGAPGEILNARLELKLIADVGVIGLPNAGKSTLLGAMSAAKPKVADYPFTTIEPNLGVVYIGNETFLMADLPGMIEGASEGRGLGHQFLRHAERNKVLLHVVDAFPLDGSEPRDNYNMIERELAAYDPELAARPRIIALNKADLGEDVLELVTETFTDVPYPLLIISAATGKGLRELAFALLAAVKENTPDEMPVVLTPQFRSRDDGAWNVEVDEDGDFHVVGKRFERMVAMTDLDNRDAVRYLVRRLKRLGVVERLQELGIQEGDTVFMGGEEFSFADW